MSVKQSGSVYRVEKRHIGQLKLYSDLACISKPERAFLLGLLSLSATREIHLSPEEDVIDITRTELQEWLKNKDIGSGLTILKKRAAALVEVKLFKKDKFKTKFRKYKIKKTQ